MPFKNQTYGANGVITSFNIYSVNNEVKSLVGPSNFVQGYNWRVRDWSTTSNWKSLLASQGWLPSRLYTDSNIKMKVVYAIDTRFRLKTNPRNGYYFSGRAGAATWPLLQLNGYDPNLLIDVKLKCLAKARNMRVNLAVAFAEGGKTIRMLTDTVRTLGNAYGAFRKGRFSQAARHLGINKPKDSLANNWLAYQYGWLPLINDAVGIASTIRDHYGAGREDYFVVRTSKTEVTTGVFECANWVVTGNHGKLYYTDVSTVRAGLRLRISSRGDKFLAGVGLSLGDVLLTTWELVPFSFVFDWFVDVGGYLESISALNGLVVLDGWTCQERTRTGNLLPSAGNGSLYTSDALPSMITRKLFRRDPWGGDSPTWPRLNGFDTLSVKRLITSAALFAQQFRGDPKLKKFRPVSSE